jgi:hypothetical protein
MAAFIDTIKAIVTRAIFSVHGVVATWRVVRGKEDPFYWYLGTTIIVLAFEGIFTLAINETQEWEWYLLLTNTFK